MKSLFPPSSFVFPVLFVTIPIANVFFMTFSIVRHMQTHTHASNDGASILRLFFTFFKLFFFFKLTRLEQFSPFSP